MPVKWIMYITVMYMHIKVSSQNLGKFVSNEAELTSTDPS